ncbi:hypothetical protein JHD48_08405 [Sulfurimonas sp. SAG-AH-194-I05]|nr:hypothetical protein [Sulfurimonas sp. SAG-AH-194-I05]MDF1875755.1 hypothetical protein [Sulfurimonas sp. SAG-AH-194-I05]
MNTRKIITTATAFIITSSSLIAHTDGVDVNTTQKSVITKEIVEKVKTVHKVHVEDIIINIPAVPVLPTVPTAPKVVTKDTQGNILTTQTIEDIFGPDKVIFSDHVAPARFQLSKAAPKHEILVGDIDNGKVAAYMHLPLMSVKDATTKLEVAGFKVLKSFKIDKRGTATSIIFTNKEMEEAASEENRGFASTLRMTIDKKNKLVTIANPHYVMKAFMQKEYNKDVAVNTLTRLRNTFAGLRNSEELVKFRVLGRYQFMENMPFYQDMKIIAKAENSVLLKRALKSKKVVYEQHLKNGSIIIGVKLGKRTSKFVKKIGFQNAGLLPYPVLIENGAAKILAPQYYIAVMYPMLKMSQFMKIATVPGAITKDIDRIFR